LNHPTGAPSYDVLLANIIVTYSFSNDTFTVTSANSGTNLLSFIEYLRLIDVQELSLASYRIQSFTAGNDTWTGGMGADEVRGLAGNDTVDGGAGDDTGNGGAGNDFLVSGADVDIARYSTATSAVTVNLSTGQATGGDGSDVLNGFENLIGADFADTLTGNSAANGIKGGGDTVTASGSNDTLSGGSGDDLFLLSLVGDFGATAQISGDTGNDTLLLTTTTASTLTSGVNVERLEIGTGAATTAINVDGSAVTSNQWTGGNSGANKITGGAGADSLGGRTI
jgi:Ca2+-binding RTX toxin-like protein